MATWEVMIGLFYFILFYFILFIYFLQIYLFVAALGLRCCARAFSSCGERGSLFGAARGPLTSDALPVADHGLRARGPQQLWHAGSAVVAHGALERRFSSCGAWA